ncbi:MAG: CocE/NonD family hydrolase [Clostridiales bacterium]|nr:CocE/NonD family hydrolase [Clostridiales bacterium]
MNDFTTNILMKVMAVKTQRELPKAIYTKIKREECKIPTLDGVNLAAMVVRPDGTDKFPCILLNNPYVVAESMYENIVLPLFAKQGYAAIYVRSRGTVCSEGEWLPFENERRDGGTMIDWVAEQPWCDGNIGTYGSSYCGSTQWCIADFDNPAFKAMYISVFGAEPYNCFYRRGMFRQDIWSYWAATMMGKNRYIANFSKKFTDKVLSFSPQCKLSQEMIGEDCDWFETWISNTKETDPYWSEGYWKEFADCAEKIKRPVFLHGGWYDIFLRPELESYRRLPEEIRSKSKIMIGPWGHSGLDVGDALKFENTGRAGFLQLKSALKWFNYMLKGEEYSEPLGVAETYCIGANKWDIWKGDIKTDEIKTFHLSGIAGKDKSGILSETIVEVEENNSYEYDPKSPTESCGGNLMSSVKQITGAERCCRVQPKPGERKDSISFVSDPLTEDLHMAGHVTVHLFVSSSASATAFSVHVMEMSADGKSINIRDDITDIRWRTDHDVEEYEPGSVVELTLPMIDCDWMLKKGSRIRVDIASSNFPAYHVHPNVTDNWAKTDKVEVAEQCIYTGGKYDSRIDIPVSYAFFS